MSYSLSFSEVTVDEFSEQSDEKRKDYPVFKDEYNGPQSLMAYDCAVEAVTSLMESGVVGDPSAVKFSINISGHANPNHVSEPGWSQDVVNISVSQVRNITPAWAKSGTAA